MIPAADLEGFQAVFRPQRTDDLQPGVEEFVGRTLTWQTWGFVEEGPYTGERMCMCVEPPPIPFAWVPESDLAPAS